MARFTPKRYEQILAGMIAKMVARTPLSDIADTSVLKHLLAAAARSDDELYFQMSLFLELFSLDKASGEDLDERALDVAGLTRLGATRATGQLVFSRTGTVGTITLPVGTKGKTSDGVSFATTEVGTILAGNTDSNPVNALADEPGAEGNVAGGAIIKFGSKPAGVDSVTNPSAFVNGSDQETDDAFRERIRQYITSLPRCTVGAIEAGLIGETDPDSGRTIFFAKVIEDQVNRGESTVYIDDGTGQVQTFDVVTGEVVIASAVGGETRLFLDTDNMPLHRPSGFTITSSIRGVLTETTDFTLNESTGQLEFNPALSAGEQVTANYTHYTGLINFAQKIINGDPNDRENYPGLRAAGTFVLAQAPTVLIQTVTLTLTIEPGFDDATVEADVATAIKNYINALTISNDVIRNELIARIMRVEGVFNIIMSVPASDIVILDDQIARIADSNITIT